MTNFQKTKDGFLLLIDSIKYNDKAYTPNMLAKKAQVDISITKQFLEGLEKTPFIFLKKSPSGILINYKFNPFSPQIYYMDLSCVIKKGHLKEGRYNGYRTIQESHEYLYAKQHFPDEAKNDGLTFISYGLKKEDLCNYLLNILEIKEEVTQEVVVDPLKAYPHVKEQVDILQKEKEKLEKEIQDEITLNAEKLKWFKEETLKAQQGKRNKAETVSTGKIIGYTHVGSYQDTSYWFDDKVREWVGKDVPQYEYITRHVPDFPKEPTYHYEKQNGNIDKIDSINRKIKNYQTYPIKYEAMLIEEKERVNKLKLLEDQKRELEREISRLKLR